MERTAFKLRSRLEGKHIHTTIFSGDEGHTLANTGILVQDIGEWGLFGAILRCGAELNEATKQHVLVIFEGDKEITEELERREKLGGKR